MIDFIYGNINFIGDNYIVIENNNIGYIVNMSTREIEELTLSEETKILTKLVVKEDDMVLYGFITRDSRLLFELLTTVSGIGPRAGLGILSTLSNLEIRQAIIEEDPKVFSKAPGVGKKSSERIILELKDKISKYSFESNLKIDTVVDLNKSKTNDSPVIEALLSLGYNRYEAKEAISGLDNSLELTELIRAALKNLGR